MKRTMLVMLFAAGTILAQTSLHQTARQIVLDYDSYVPASFLEVDQGTMERLLLWTVETQDRLPLQTGKPEEMA